MAGRGMGAATQGGGAVSSGPRNKTQSNPASKSTGIPMLAKGGAVNQHKRMAMGEKVMADGGPVTGATMTNSERARMAATTRGAGAMTDNELRLLRRASRRPTDAINPDALRGTTPPPEGRAAPKRKLTAKEMEARLGKAKGGMAKKMNYGGMAKKRTMRKGGCA